MTVAGIVEATKVLHTKKGESMAIITMEDPTGKIEVMLFPRTYMQYKDMLEKTDSILVMAGTLDMRMGAPQLKMEAMKCASLETMVKNAKESGMFSDDEATNWRAASRQTEETVEVVSEEGEVIAAVTVPIESVPSIVVSAEKLHGPIAEWIKNGMQTEEPLSKVGLQDYSLNQKNNEEQPADVNSATHYLPTEALAKAGSLPTTHSPISIHTITLPARAPRELLLEVKSVFETFPGPEKIQLKIGTEIVPVGLTVTMSPIFEKRIEQVVQKYTAAV